MTKQYDFVVTSGGIGPTHDGEFQLLKIPYLAIRGHTSLLSSTTTLSTIPLPYFSSRASLYLHAYSSRLLPPFFDFLTTSILASQCATNTNRILGPSRSIRLRTDRVCLLSLDTELIYRYHLRISGRSL